MQAGGADRAASARESFAAAALPLPVATASARGSCSQCPAASPPPLAPDDDAHGDVI